MAWGSFSDVINKTGWAVLDIHTVPGAEVEELLEGKSAGNQGFPMISLMNEGFSRFSVSCPFNQGWE